MVDVPTYAAEGSVVEAGRHRAIAAPHVFTLPEVFEQDEL
jgi:hypothetical protein